MSRRPPRGFFEGGESPFGRLPTEPSFPTIRVSRRGVIWIIVVAVLLLLLFLLKPFATLYTDYLWFRALGFGGVFGTRFAAQIWSFFIFAILFWVIGGAEDVAGHDACTLLRPAFSRLPDFSLSLLWHLRPQRIPLHP